MSSVQVDPLCVCHCLTCSDLTANRFPVFSFHVHLLYISVTLPYQVRHLVLMYLHISCLVFLKRLLVWTCCLTVMGFRPGAQTCWERNCGFVCSSTAAFILIFGVRSHWRLCSSMLGRLCMTVCLCLCLKIVALVYKYRILTEHLILWSCRYLELSIMSHDLHQ